MSQIVENKGVINVGGIAGSIKITLPTHFC
jgi:hypothetical protein